MSSSRWGHVAAAALVLAAVVSLSGCDWMMSGFDGSHTGDNAGEAMMTPASVATLSRRWQAPGASGTVGPVVAGGTVFTMDDRRDPQTGAQAGWGVRALVVSSGAVIWSKVLATSGGPPSDGLAVSGSTLFVPGPGTLLALDVANGSQRWSAPARTGWLADPVVVGSSVFLTDGAFDVASGRLLWRASDPTATVMAVANGVAVMSTQGQSCTGAGTVWGVDAASGAVLWWRSAEATRQPVFATVVDHRVAVSMLGCNQGWPTVAGTDVLDVSSGAKAWSIDSEWMQGAAAHQLLGMGEAGFQAYSVDSGAPRWSTPASGCGMSEPGARAATSGQVTFVANMEDVCAVDVVSGAVLGRWPVHNSWATATANGCVYASGGSDTDGQYALTKFCIDGSG